MPLKPVKPTYKPKPGEIKLRNKRTGEYFAIPQKEWETIKAIKRIPGMSPTPKEGLGMRILRTILPGTTTIGRGLGLALARLTPEIQEIERKVSEGTASPEELRFYYQTFGKEAPTPREIITAFPLSVLEIVGLAKLAEAGIGRLTAERATEEIPWQTVPSEKWVVPRRGGGEVRIPGIKWRLVPHPKYPGLEKLEIEELPPSIFERIGEALEQPGVRQAIRTGLRLGRKSAPWLVGIGAISRFLR